MVLGKSIPDPSLELEWQLFKRVQLEEGPIPNKYRELIGVAISAITKCRYCATFHTEIANLMERLRLRLRMRFIMPNPVSVGALISTACNPILKN
jgi:AhpD family alkylhydroperoxidase